MAETWKDWEEEFCLSNLEMTDKHGSKYLYSEQVREFIKRLKEEIRNGDLYRCVNCKSNLKFIDKIAGDSLNGK